jgi:hypothetical protein
MSSNCETTLIILSKYLLNNRLQKTAKITK